MVSTKAPSRVHTFRIEVPATATAVPAVVAILAATSAVDPKFSTLSLELHWFNAERPDGPTLFAVAQLLNDMARTILEGVRAD